MSRCPYCFETFTTLHFRCVNRGGCKLEPDVKLQNYRRLPVAAAKDLGRVFEGFGKTSAVCPPPCGVPTSRAVCPHCHNDLPVNDISAKSLLFALVGAKNVGKSQYIGVLINELQEIAPLLGAGIMPLGQTIAHYNSNFRRYLYDAHSTVPVTQPAQSNLTVRIPLIYRWSRRVNGFEDHGGAAISFAERTRVLISRTKRLIENILKNKKFTTFDFGSLTRDSFNVSNLVFFDTAGEDLRDEDVMDVHNRYVALSNGLIFLLDPLQIKSVRDRLRKEVGCEINLPEEDADDPLEILVRVTEIIKKIRGIGNEELIEIPIAVTFSKIDAIRPLLDQGSPLHQASPHRHGFSATDVERVHESVKAHLMEWTGKALEGLLSTNYARYRYFGVSALGKPPRADGLLYNGAAPAPVRVEDPVLWLLSLHDLVQIREKS